MRKYLYFNEDNTLRCNARDIQRHSFTSFNNSTIDLQSGKYMVSIDISATVTESFYDAIDASTEEFTDSPFYITSRSVPQILRICAHRVAMLLSPLQSDSTHLSVFTSHDILISNLLQQSQSAPITLIFRIPIYMSYLSECKQSLRDCALTVMPL